MLEDLQLTTEWRVYLVGVADPYVLVGTEDDDLILVSLRPSASSAAVVSVKDGVQLSRHKHRSPGEAGCLNAPNEVDDEGQEREENLPHSNYLQLTRPKVGQVSCGI